MVWSVPRSLGAVASTWTVGRLWKRAFDLAVAAPMLVLFAPVAGAVAVLVRLRLGSPILFRQERAGRGGMPILVPKFRSMTDERDSLGELLPDGERLTPFGARLRATSLDELPQLWTVVKGDMSIVGPRPLPMVYVERYNSHQRRRLEAKPGITGWAQINGRNSVSWGERLEMDVWYVDNASLRLDLVILAKTVRSALRRDNVTAEGHPTMPEFMGGE